MAGDALRTDERRALTVLAEGNTWLGAAPGGPAARPQAWVQLSKYKGDELPVGWDVFEGLRSAGYLVPGRRVRGAARQYRLSDTGRRALGAGPAPARSTPAGGQGGASARPLADRVSRLLCRSGELRQRSRDLRIAVAASLSRARSCLVHPAGGPTAC